MSRNFDYPSRSFITVFERRFQDLERRFENMHRIGKVSDVKYDEEKKRWFVKMEDGTDPNDKFKTDWMPWETQSSGFLQVSIPPKKGQQIQMQSPSGLTENAVARAYHNNKENPSPHDKEDEAVIQFTKPKKEENQSQGQSNYPSSNSGSSDDKQSEAYKADPHQKGEPALRIRAGHDGYTITVGKLGQSQKASAEDGDGSDEDDKKTFQMKVGRDAQTITCGKFKGVIGKDGAKLTWGDKVSFELKDGQIETVVDGAKHTLTKDNIVSMLGNAKHTLTKDNIVDVVGGMKQTLTTSDFKVDGGKIVHDGRNIGKDHIHSGVMPGLGKTQFPDP